MNGAPIYPSHRSRGLGRFGIWSGELRFAGPEAGVVFAKELEDLGWSDAWMPGGVDDKILDDIDRLLSVTETLTFCTGRQPRAQHRRGL